MDNRRLASEEEKQNWEFNFTSKGTEDEYVNLRSSRVLNLFPRFLLLILCVSIVGRRTQLFIKAAQNQGVSTFEEESKVFAISLVALFLELITHVISPFSSLRCVCFAILSFYTAAEGSIGYYQTRVKDEPVYAFG